MTKKELKDHFKNKLAIGELDKVLLDVRFQDFAKNYMTNSNKLIELSKNEKYKEVVYMAAFFILT